MQEHRNVLALLDDAKGLIEEARKGDWKTIADFGCGRGLQTRALAGEDRTAYGVDPRAPVKESTERTIFVNCRWEDLPDHYAEAGYSYHALEHALSPILALASWGRAAVIGGPIYIGVPAPRDQVVSGHITSGWTIGQLAYHLVLAGFDCKDGRFRLDLPTKTVWAVVRSPGCVNIRDHKHLWELKEFFPQGMIWLDNLHAVGDYEELNW